MLLKPPTHTPNLPGIFMLPVGSTALQENPVPAASGVLMKLSLQAMSQRPDRQRGLPLAGVGHCAAVVQPAGQEVVQVGCFTGQGKPCPRLRSNIARVKPYALIAS